MAVRIQEVTKIVGKAPHSNLDALSSSLIVGPTDIDFCRVRFTPLSLAFDTLLIPLVDQPVLA